MSVSATIAISSSGVIIPAVPGFQIVVVGCALVARVATDVKFQSNGTTDLMGAIPLAATAGFVLPSSTLQYAWMKTNIGESLNLNMTNPTDIGGVIIYDLI
jgi:hypothetical protein